MDEALSNLVRGIREYDKVRFAFPLGSPKLSFLIISGNNRPGTSLLGWAANRTIRTTTLAAVAVVVSFFSL